MTDEERNEQNEERDDEERSDEDEGQDAEASSEDQTSGQDDSGDDDSGDEDSGEEASGSGDEQSSSSDDDDDDESESGGGTTTSVSDVMTKDPQSVEPGDSIEDAAKKMKEADTGALLVVDGDELKGIVTDRDIVVNAIAEGNTDASVEDVCSTDTTTIEPDATLGDAIQIMRDKKVRRLPVVENDEPVGIVSLGDLAIEADDDSALKEISAAEANA